MKMPRIFSNGISKWSLLAALPLLAAGTFIVASEEPGVQQQEFTVGTATGFVMFDETSTGELEAMPPGDLVAPNARALDQKPQGAYQFGAQAAYAESSKLEPTLPVVRPAFAPTLHSSADDVGLTMDATRFVASDEVSLQGTESLLSEQAAYSAEPASPSTYSLTEGTPQGFTMEDADNFAAIPEGLEAVEAVISPREQQRSLGFTMEDAGGLAVTSYEPEWVQPPAQQRPQGFTMEDLSAVTGDAPPQVSGEGTASPSNQLTRLPSTTEESAPAPRIEIRPTADYIQYGEASNSAQSVPPPPVELAPEAVAMDQYQVVAEDPYFAEPAMSADCCMACPRSWYAKAELMYVQRISKDMISLTDGDLNGLDRMDFTPGARVTVGRIRDCLDGYELSYTGGFEWTERSLIAGDNLNPKFVSDRFDISAFTGAKVHTQEYRSDFHSVELNKKWWGWDVISTTLGVRYIDVREKYRFDSLDANGDRGTLKSAIDNSLLGPQLGLDLYRPVGRFTTEMRFKGGVYLNYVDFDYNLVNAGVEQFSVGSEKGQLALEGEIGFFAKYQLLPRVTIQAGYEFWYLYGVATPTSQDRSRIRAEDGAYSEDDIYYHGGSVGVEMVW